MNDFARFHFIFLTQCASEGGPQLYEIEGFLRTIPPALWHVKRLRVTGDRQFLFHLEQFLTGGTDLEFEPISDSPEVRKFQVHHLAQPLYSLRHTAICMRIILSQGKVSLELIR